MLPLLALDHWVTLYQSVCFPIYGIARVPRRRYFAIDRHKLAYLNGIEKVNCIFCIYANGLIAYIREVAARTEQYWCPIKHARAIPVPHSRYQSFLDSVDAEQVDRPRRWDITFIAWFMVMSGLGERDLRFRDPCCPPARFSREAGVVPHCMVRGIPPDGNNNRAWRISPLRSLSWTAENSPNVRDISHRRLRLLAFFPRNCFAIQRPLVAAPLGGRVLTRAQVLPWQLLASARTRARRATHAPGTLGGQR